MPNNPLQQYFRQPKVFIKLPSQGIYSKPGVITGDTDNMPVFGMTGMDEIIMKTPDALLTGESTVKVIESCCPGIKDAWELSNIDIEPILSAIRIATYGNTFSISHTCSNCGAENDYDLELSKLIDHFNYITFDNKLVLKDLVIKLRPITYKEITDFSMKNFKLQQLLKQARQLEDEEERNSEVSRLFVEFGALQREIYSANIESVEAGNMVVTERAFIDEWLQNSDKAIFDQISQHVDRVRDEWKTPPQEVKCDSCNHEEKVAIELDHAYFFATA